MTKVTADKGIIDTLDKDTNTLSEHTQNAMNFIGDFVSSVETATSNWQSNETILQAWDQTAKNEVGHDSNY